MMYNLSEKMAKVSHFSIIKNKKLLICNEIFYVEAHIYNVLPMLWQADITNDNVWIKDNNWENYLLNISGNSIIKLDFNIGLNGAISNIIVIFKNNILSCFSTIKNEVVVNFPKVEKIKSYLSNDKSIFFQVETTIKSLSLLTGEYEWEIDLSQYGEIRYILGVVENELYVWIGNRLLVALRTQTGTVLWTLNTAENHNAYGNSGIHFLPDERKVVIFYEIYNIEIDLATRSSTLLYKGTFGQSWEFATSTVSGNYIYFTGRNYATGELSVGVFNRQSLQVEWYYAAPEWQGRVPDDYEGNAVVLNSAPQVSDDKLYVLENGTGTLYIFEKEPTT